MSVKSFTAGLAGAALITTAAFAQQPTSTQPMSTSDRPDTASATSASYQGDWRASKLVGLSVYNAKNENVGSIGDLLTDKSGSIKAAVISVGGFLGVGSRLVAVPFDKVKFSTEPVAYTGVAGGTTNGTTPPMNRPPSTTTGSAAGNQPAMANNAKPNPWYPDHAVFDASKDDLQKMPEFKYTTE
jgi:sporulation protein YlmC with PRC-barrel domain